MTTNTMELKEYWISLFVFLAALIGSTSWSTNHHDDSNLSPTQSQHTEQAPPRRPLMIAKPASSITDNIDIGTLDVQMKFVNPTAILLHLSQRGQLYSKADHPGRLWQISPDGHKEEVNMEELSHENIVVREYREYWIVWSASDWDQLIRPFVKPHQTSISLKLEYRDGTLVAS